MSAFIIVTELFDSQHLETQILPVADQVVRLLGLDLVKLEFRREKNGLVLRVVIDKEGGVSVHDCQVVSNELGTTLLGEGYEDLIPGPYHLEVTSPGVDRTLTREKDYRKHLGREVKIVFQDGPGKKSGISGTLTSYGSGKLTVYSAGGERVISLDHVVSARVVFDWKSALKMKEREQKLEKKEKGGSRRGRSH